MAVYRKTDDPYSDPNEEPRQLPMHTGDYHEDEEAKVEGGEGFKMPKMPAMPAMPSMDSLKGLIKGVNTMFDDIVIALGSENVYVASREQPEPTSYAAYVAITKANNQVIALGDKARAMVGREPENIEVIRVLDHGVPENPDVFGAFLQRLLRKHFSAGKLARPRILCSGNFHSPLLKQTCSEGLFQIKSRDILFCEPEIAAAVGAGLDIMEPDLKSVLVFERDWLGFMIISMTGSLTRLRLNIGFDTLLEDIGIYFEESNQFAPRAEDLEQQFRNAGFTGTQALAGWEAWVDQVERGKPVTIEADSAEYQKAVTPTLLRIKHKVNHALDTLTREQRYTIQTTPTYLAGDYGDLPGLKELLERVFGREFKLAPQPGRAMASGMVGLIPNIELLRAINGGGQPAPQNQEF